MPEELQLAAHVVFKELPFCGVLLDKRRFTVHRLSLRAASALRLVLYRGAPAPFGWAAPQEPNEELERQLVHRLLQLGMLQKCATQRAVDST